MARGQHEKVNREGKAQCKERRRTRVRAAHALGSVMCVFKCECGAGEPAFGGSVEHQHRRQTAGLRVKSFIWRHRSSYCNRAEMSTGDDTPQPVTAPTATGDDAPNLAVSGGTLGPGVLEATQAAVHQEVRAALSPAPSSSNPPAGGSAAPSAPGTASGNNSTRGSSGTVRKRQGAAARRLGQASWSPTAACPPPPAKAVTSRAAALRMQARPKQA